MASQWRGYRPPAEPPAPAPGTWGDHPPLPSVLAQAAAETGDLRVVVGNPWDRSEEPAGGGAGEPRAGVHGTRTREFYRTARSAEKPPPGSNTEAPHRLTVPTATNEASKAAIERERRDGPCPPSGGVHPIKVRYRQSPEDGDGWPQRGSARCRKLGIRR